MQDLKVTLIQTSLHWESTEKNLELFESKTNDLKEQTDLIVLPEMFTTGFTMNPEQHAEPENGPGLQWMQKRAGEMDTTITGSISTRVGDRYYNRMYWVNPDGSFQFYDKKHLFSYAGEDQHYSAGEKKLIIDFRGWKILLIVCFDLRFPVWCRNAYDHEKGFDYDAMICIANWPEMRSHAWRILLMSRAIENQAYTIGVNRVGEDGNGIPHSGDSGVMDAAGESVSYILPHQTKTETVTLSSESLVSFREKFRFAPEWDRFRMM